MLDRNQWLLWTLLLHLHTIIKDIMKTFNELRVEPGFAVIVTELALDRAMDTIDYFRG